MDLKEYQQDALAIFRRWRDALLESQSQQREGAEPTLDEGGRQVAPAVDAPARAWEMLRKQGLLPESAGVHVPRHDAAGRAIPHVCFKVPTGGGKTLLAAAALRSLHRDAGLVLWITPTAAIYQQTKDALRNRQHPCRQLLDTGAGGRVKFMEKDDPLTRDDLDNHLCIMLLSLPAANRQRNRDFLRMFRNSGRYPTLFPPADVDGASSNLLREFPDLDVLKASGSPNGRPGIKHSLFNVFKMQRPVVILDEAHKAYGSRDPRSNQEYVRAINQFDPSLVVELSATPNPGISNLLVDISGTRLRDEQMVKLPVLVENYPGADWRHVMSQAAAGLSDLESAADTLRSSSSRYVRPIAVVRVERTGQDQRDVGRVHAEDVREYLIRGLGVPANQVAVQSSESREISGQDLTSPYSQIRWIITKAALMEGWDCPFAYVLVMLDNTTAQRAITQLVGRIMRQPDARRTGFRALDQCYVMCTNSDVEVAVRQVKRGLEREGLADLADEVFENREDAPATVARRIPKQKSRGDLAPTVLHKKHDGWVPLDYQKHILPDIHWSAVVEPRNAGGESFCSRVQSVVVDVDDALSLTEPSGRVAGVVRIEWFARQLGDLMPNPWMAARLAKDFLALLAADGYSPARIHQERSQIAAALRDHMAQAVDVQADRVFRSKLRKGVIRLELGVDQLEAYGADTRPTPVTGDGVGAERDRPTVARFGEVSGSETDLGHRQDRGFAWYLDEPGALSSWRRFAVGQRGDRLRIGRREPRLWPDFVVATRPADEGMEALLWTYPQTQTPKHSAKDWEATFRRALDTGLDCGTVRVDDGPARGNYRLLFSELNEE